LTSRQPTTNGKSEAPSTAISVAALLIQAIDTSTGHLGNRCVVRRAGESHLCAPNDCLRYHTEDT
jgi:hypothetical protein